MKQNNLVISEKEDGLRIDVAISMLDESVSRTLAVNLIKDKKVLLDGKEVKASTKVKKDQIITLPENVFIPINEKIMPEDIKVDILYEDDDIIVVNKPKNMVVHPAAR